MRTPETIDDLRRRASAGRLGRLRQAADAAGLDGVVAYGSGHHSLGRSNPCWYLSGVKQIGADACLVVPVEGEPILVVTPGWEEERARRRGWIDDVVGVDCFAEGVGEAVRSRGLHGRGVGLLGLGGASPAAAEALGAAVGEQGRAFEVFDAVAGVQDELSRALIEEAVEIAEAGFVEVCRAVVSGTTEYELAAVGEFAIRSLGADDNFQLIAASQRHPAIRPPLERRIFEGDVILAELSPSVDGQFAQICRTAVVGEPTAQQAHCYAILEEALSAGLEACRPGSPVRAVAESVNGVLADHGFAAFNRPPYMRNRGHGLGLASTRPGSITTQSEELLEVGMSFVLHPNQFFPEAGYLLCGDQVVVEEGGARIIAESPARLCPIPLS